jgi:hypothetical protein
MSSLPRDDQTAMISEVTNPTTAPAPPAPASRPSDLATPTPGNPETTTSKWLSEKAIDNRFIPRSASTAKPTIRPKVNFYRLFLRIAAILRTSYVQWDKLRESIIGRVFDTTGFIVDGCNQLAIASIYILYSHLRSVAGKHDFANADVYEKRCKFDYRTQLPTGLIYIIQQFGLCLLEDVWLNPRVIHTWDKEDDKTYGIPATTPFSSETFESFMTTLVQVGVKVDRLPALVVPHSAWDSLLIVEASDNQGAATFSDDYDIFTTLPIKNYNLPRDIFLAIALANTTSIDPATKTPIEFYGPRISTLGTDAAVKPIYTAEDKDDSAAAKTRSKKRKSLVSKADDVDPKKALPCTPFEYMTVQGVELPGADATKQQIWVYGRGTADDVVPILSVGRGIDANEIENYFRHLFRNGP